MKNCGISPNIGVYFAILKLEDKVIGLNLSQGGHLTHDLPANISGQYFEFIEYSVNKEDGRIDYDDIRKKLIKF